LTDKVYSIQISNDDLDEGQLKMDSAIRADKVYTFSKRIVNNKFGHIRAVRLEDVKKQLDHLFDD
jgi:mRNA interferase MazF